MKIIDTNQFTNKKEENISYLEGSDNDDSNPFKLDFGLFWKKNFIENPYYDNDDNKSFYLGTRNKSDNSFDEKLA